MRHRLLLLSLLVGWPLSGWAQLTQTELSESADKAAAFLKNAQTSDGAIADSSNALFNTWETILVTHALLDQFSASDSTIQRALGWLSRQTNPQGLICHNTRCSASYCVETSAAYLQLLLRLDSAKNIRSQLDLIAQLQEPNGSWKIVNPDVYEHTDFPSVTAFVLNLFRSANYPAGNTAAAQAFIRSNQLQDGSLGQSWEYYGCPGYALWQCLPVLRSDSTHREAWQKSLDFILSSQLPDGSWYTIDPTKVNNTSAQLQTAFMLHCLLPETDTASRAAFSRGMRFLLDSQQENGAWDGGLFPIPNARYKKREYLVATALIYRLLIASQQTLPHE